jgi:hypothetical protein
MTTYTTETQVIQALKRLLPLPALRLFLKAANESRDIGLDHNEAMQAGWSVVKDAGYQRSKAGRWVKKDDPGAGDVHVPVPLGGDKPKKKPDEMRKVSTLYVNRPLLNAADLQDWAKQQGFASMLPADDLHTTILYSKQPFDASDLEPDQELLVVPAGSDGRSLSRFGDGASVLRFNHQALQDRHQEMRDAGASSDYDEFRPHVTLTYQGDGVDHDAAEPYSGPLIFGPEEFAPVQENWSDNLQEDAVKSLQIMKVDDDQRTVYGWASVISEGGRPYVDSQGDIIEPDMLTKATTDFMMDVRKAMAMHQRTPDGRIDDSMLKGVVVHSFPLTAALAKSLGISSDKEGWMVGLKITDEPTWQLVKSGKLRAFSIGGVGDREEVQV